MAKKNNKLLFVIAGIVLIILIGNQIGLFATLFGETFDYEENVTFLGEDTIAFSTRPFGQNIIISSTRSLKNLVFDSGIDFSCSGAGDSGCPPATTLIKLNEEINIDDLQRLEVILQQENSVGSPWYSLCTSGHSLIYFAREGEKIDLFRSGTSTTQSGQPSFTSKAGKLIVDNLGNNQFIVQFNEESKLVELYGNYSLIFRSNGAGCGYGGSGTEKLTLSNLVIQNIEETECSTGQVTCNWVTNQQGICVNKIFVWGYIDGECGYAIDENDTIICTSGQTKCSGTIYYTCSNNDWLSQGNVEGKCGYSTSGFNINQVLFKLGYFEVTWLHLLIVLGILFAIPLLKGRRR